MVLVAGCVCMDAASGCCVLTAGRRGVQRHVVEVRADPRGRERGDEAVARRAVGELQAVEVRVVLGALRHDRPVDEPRALERLEGGVVGVPDRHPRGVDLRDALELGGEQRRADVGEQKRRAEVDPRVVIDVAAREAAAVGPLLLEDLRALDERLVVDEQRAALAAGDVLRLVEGERPEGADRPQRPAAVGGVDALRGVLDEQQVVRLRQRAEGVHVTGDPAVVDGDDRPRALRDGVGGALGVDVQRGGIDVDEDRRRAAQDERVGGRDERERRHDDLVAGADAAEQRGHLQRPRAGVRHEHARRAGELGQQPLAVQVARATLAASSPVRNGRLNGRR